MPLTRTLTLLLLAFPYVLSFHNSLPIARPVSSQTSNTCLFVEKKAKKEATTKKAAAPTKKTAPKAASKKASVEAKADVAVAKKAAPAKKAVPAKVAVEKTPVESFKKADFVTALAEKTGMNKKDSETALQAVLDTLMEQVSSGKKVSFVGFGTFALKDRAARKGRNPQTGEELFIPASKLPSFTAAKAWKESVN